MKQTEGRNFTTSTLLLYQNSESESGSSSESNSELNSDSNSELVASGSVSKLNSDSDSTNTHSCPCFLFSPNTSLQSGNKEEKKCTEEDAKSTSCSLNFWHPPLRRRTFVFLAATFGRPPQRSSVVVTEEEKEKEQRFCQSRYPLHPIRKSSARQEQHKTTSNRRFEESIVGYL